MKRKRLLLLGSVCLALMLAVPLAVSCGPAAPEEGAEAELQEKLAAEKAKSAGLEDEIAELEAEVAALRAPAEEVYHWKFQHYWGTGENWLFASFGEQLEKLSDGRITVDTYSDGALVPGSEVFEALRTGVLDISFNEGSLWGQLIPVGDVEFLVGHIARDMMAARILMDERVDYEGEPFGFGLSRIVREQYLEKQGVCYILPHFNDVATLMLKEPIEKYADLKGRKIFLMPLSARVLEPSGLVPAVIPPEELYTSLAAGIIDGVVWGGTACGWDMGWQEVCTCVVRPNVNGIIMSNFTMAPEAWYALPNGLKAAVEAAILSNSNFMKTAYTYREIAKQKAMEEEYGLEVVNLPPEETAKYFQWCFDVLDELMQVDDASREAGEIVKDWARFVGYID